VKVNSWYLMAGPFAMALSSGFYEELLLRGILFRIIERPLGTWISLTISALVFGAGHLANPGATLFTSAAIAVEAGVLLAGAYMMTRRLWVPIGIHFGWNFAQGGIFGIAVSGNPVVGWLTTSLEGPKLLSGGSFGAEASIVAVTLCTCTGGWFVWRSIRLGQIRPPMWAARRETVDPPGV
jgi:membrane protease YdiL (CAAX protease family)